MQVYEGCLTGNLQVG